MESPGRPPMRSFLPSEVAKIPAKISNLEVIQPQGHPKRGWRAVNSHFPFLHMSQRRPHSLHHVSHCREEGQQRQCVLQSEEVAKIPGPDIVLETIVGYVCLRCVHWTGPNPSRASRDRFGESGGRIQHSESSAHPQTSY